MAATRKVDCERAPAGADLRVPCLGGLSVSRLLALRLAERTGLRRLGVRSGILRRLAPRLAALEPMAPPISPVASDRLIAEVNGTRTMRMRCDRAPGAEGEGWTGSASGEGVVCQSKAENRSCLAPRRQPPNVSGHAVRGSD